MTQPTEMNVPDVPNVPEMERYSSDQPHFPRDVLCSRCSQSVDMQERIHAQLRAVRISRSWIQRARCQLLKAAIYSNNARIRADRYMTQIQFYSIKKRAQVDKYFDDKQSQGRAFYRQMLTQARGHYKMALDMAEAQAKHIINRSKAKVIEMEAKQSERSEQILKGFETNAIDPPLRPEVKVEARVDIDPDRAHARLLPGPISIPYDLSFSMAPRSRVRSKSCSLF